MTSFQARFRYQLALRNIKIREKVELGDTNRKYYEKVRELAELERLGIEAIVKKSRDNFEKMLSESPLSDECKKEFTFNFEKHISAALINY